MSTRRNFSRAARRINRYAAGVREATQDALAVIGEEIMTDVRASSPNRGVPRDTGDLAASGRVRRLSAAQVLLSFGDSTVRYAMIQHENMDYHHTVGEPRYLVRGVERWRPGGSAAIEVLKLQAQLVGQRVGRGG